MSGQEFILVVALGAAALALWLDVRLAARTPRSVVWTIANLGGSLAALQVMPSLVTLVVAGGDDPSRQIAATLLVLLPVLTYCWLSAIWLLKLLQRVAQPRL
jgi:hypothetical protein